MEITKEVMRDLRTVQEGGLTNMHDRMRVQGIANEYKLWNLANYMLETGSDGYSNLLGAYDSEVEPDKDVVSKMRGEK